MNPRISGILAVLITTGLLISSSLFLLARAPQALPTPTIIDEPLVIIEGEMVNTVFWTEQYLLDQVMSTLAGQPSPQPRQTLDRLINETLLLQAYPPQSLPSDEDITERVRLLHSAWNIDPQDLYKQLNTLGLNKDTFTHTVKRLLLVEQAQMQLSENMDVNIWIHQQREKANISINEKTFRKLLQTITLP